MSDCGISFLLHGPSKSGKTWLSCTSPAPRLLLDSEGNSRFVKGKKITWNPITDPAPPAGDWDTCITYIRDFNTLSYAYQWLSSGKHCFKSVMIDSVSEAQQRCIDALVGADQLRIQDWGTLLRSMSQLVRQYRDLLVHPTTPLSCVVFTAMSKQDKAGKFVPFVQGQLATSLPYYIDCVCYLKGSMDDENKFTNFLLTKPHDLYECGDRTGMFPTIITNPNLSDMVEMVCNQEGN